MSTSAVLFALIWCAVLIIWLLLRGIVNDLWAAWKSKDKEQE